MFLLTAGNAPAYLRQHWSTAGPITVTSLGGGVSNTVLLAECNGDRIVCKQALEKLRVDADWRSRPERTLREAAALRALQPILPEHAIPTVTFVDANNCIYGMSAAPASASDWKTLLLKQTVHPENAAAAGSILGTIVQSTWHDSPSDTAFGDQTVFDELRLDPYYRFTADRHPSVAAHFHSLIERCRVRRESLVHGDWSPKNLLVDGDRVMAIDFEVVHFGDPCFDTGFLINHLVLKSLHLPAVKTRLMDCALAFWSAFIARYPGDPAGALQGTLQHLAGLLLARVDGKSPAEYLTPDERSQARRLALRWIQSPPETLESIWQCL